MLGISAWTGISSGFPACSRPLSTGPGSTLRCSPERNTVTFLPMKTSPDPSRTPREALCKRVLALLAPTPAPPGSLWEGLERAFGPIEYRGGFLPFDTTEYYRGEFGADLFRG